MEQNKTGKYLKYAIGEIALVVIGILIALQINNWNESRKESDKLNQVYERILIDVENDLNELSANLAYYKKQEHVFKAVVNDSISLELLDDGLSRVLFESFVTKLNKAGVNQLKVLTSKDSLSLKIIEIYDVMENFMVQGIEKDLNNDSRYLANIFRDNYTWFPEWQKKTIMKDNSSKELQDYFLTSMQYKHHMIQANQDIYNNYVPMIEYSIFTLKDIKEELQSLLDKT
ncbi:MAG: hypothetical protein DA407_01435 [Bacteroidetes bacterium]|nr:MAG: hypothetical protein DA407_01435 [Bacteroidota bacterium]